MHGPLIAVKIQLLSATRSLEGRVFEKALQPPVEALPMWHLESPVMGEHHFCPE